MAQGNPNPKTEHLAPWQYKPGHSGNKKGRKRGKTLKEHVQDKLAKMTFAEREKFLEGIDKKIVWEMAEGKAEQGVKHSGSLGISQVLDELEQDKSKDNGQKTGGQKVEDK